MFPKELLDVELVSEENSLELYVLIKRTTQDLKAKKDNTKLREMRFTELQRFVHARKLSGSLESTREALL